MIKDKEYRGIFFRQPKTDVVLISLVSLCSQQDERRQRRGVKVTRRQEKVEEDASGETCFTFTSRTYPQCRRVTFTQSYRMTNHYFGNSQ
jgi:hypothetical protein